MLSGWVSLNYPSPFSDGVFTWLSVRQSHSLMCINAVQAQPGTVESWMKISSTEGGFTGSLDNDDRFAAVAPLGDLDGDGYQDIAVGAYQDDDGGIDFGAIWILFLNQDGSVKSHQKISSTTGGFTGTLHNSDYFGFQVSPLGDLDGDEVMDIVVSAWADDDGFTNAGAVWILFLNTDGTVKANQKISHLQGGFNQIPGSSYFFGIGLSAIGDFNGDNIPDVAVGTGRDDDGGADRGAVWLLYLNTDGTVNSWDKISSTQGNFTGQLNNNDQFGRSVSSLGDLNGDGVTDLAVGSMLSDLGGTDQGAVWILFMNADGTVNSHQKISDNEGFDGGLDPGDQAGLGLSASSLSRLHDINGDGIQDLAVSAHADDDGGFNHGAIYILFMNTNGTVNGLQKISDTQGNFDGILDDSDSFGGILSFNGDMDGDGTIELLVGVGRDDDGGLDKGAVYILSLETTQNDTLIYPIEGEFPPHFAVPNDVTPLAYARFGNSYNLDEIVRGSCPSGWATGAPDATVGFFNLSFCYELLENNPYNTNILAVINAVFQDVSVLIVRQGCNGNLPLVNIHINAPTGMNAANPGAASQFYIPEYEIFTNLASENSGILNGEVWRAINTSVNDPFLFDARVDLNLYNLAWIFNTDLNANTTDVGLEVDLYSVLLHEIIHALGFASLIDANGLSRLSTTSFYSKYDTYLQRNGLDLIDWDNLYSTQFNPAVSAASDLQLGCPNVLNFNGINTTNLPIANFNDGALSHFGCLAPLGLQVMKPGILTGQELRTPTCDDINVLKELGYQITGLWNSIQICPANNVGVIGRNDGFYQNNDACSQRNLMELCNVGTDAITINFSDILTNDINANSITGLQILTSNGTFVSNATSFTYTPAQPGLVYFRYIPVNTPTGQIGNITAIIIEVFPCNTLNGCYEPDVCNQVCNSNFECPGGGCGTNFTNPPINWATSHGTPDFYGDYVYQMPGNPGGIAFIGAAFMPSSCPSGLWSEGMLTNVNIIQGQRYTLSYYRRKTHMSVDVPLQHLFVRLINSASSPGIPGPVLDQCFPGVPVINQEIVHETDIIDQAWEQVTACFVADADYDRLWFYPLMTQYANPAFVSNVFIDHVVLVEDNYTAGPDAQTTCGGVNIGIDACDVDFPSYSWINQIDNNVVGNTEQILVNVPQNTSFQVTRSYPDNPNTLTFPITTDNCTIIDDVSVTVTAPLSFEIESANFTCDGSCGGSASVVNIINGTAPFYYLWSANTGNQITSTATNLCADVYSVTVTDANGCSASAELVAHSFSVTPVTTSESCAGTCDGTITLNVVSDNDPVTYIWSNGQSSGSLSNLCVGTYTVTLSDNIGCTAEESFDVITNPSLFTAPPPLNTITSGSQEYWDQVNYTVEEDIVVEYNSLLVLTNCTLQFNSNAGIIVKNGGKLIISTNSLLTGLISCDNTWKGIEVYGDRFEPQPQNPYVLNTPQGFVHLRSGSIIKDAVTGINNGGFGPIYGKRGGAVIWMESNSTIMSFQTGVSLGFYANNNMSKFNDCNFIINREYNNAKNYTCIELAPPNKANVDNVVFENQNPALDIYKLNGIVGTYIGEIKNSTFTNMSYGISCSGALSLIDYNIFNNVKKGVFLRTSSYFSTEITNNQFLNIPPAEPIVNDDFKENNWGIYLTNSYNYKIENNVFDGSASADPSQAHNFGIVVDNTWTGVGTVYDNYFRGTDVGIQTQKDNSNLNIRCNNFNSDNLGNEATSLHTETAWATLGELMQQGSDQCNYDDIYAAGNEWKNLCTGTSEIDIKLDAGANSFWYYAHYQDIDGYLKVKPLCSTTTWEQDYLYGCTQPKTTNSCTDDNPLNLTAPTNPIFIQQLEERIAAISAGTSLIQEGDAQALKNLIVSNAPAGTLKIELLAASPYLSDNVLISAISEKATPLPAGHIKEIIVANSPVISPVMDIVNSLTLPNGIKKQIVDAQTGISEREKLEKEIAYNEAQVRIMQNTAVDYYIENNDMAQVISILETSESYSDKKRLSEIYLLTDNYSSCISALNDVINTAGIENEEDAQAYFDITTILINLAQEDKTIAEMDAVQEQTVRDIAAGNTPTAVQAQVILETVYDDEFSYPILRFNTATPRSLRVNNSTMQIESAKSITGFNLYPNPANDKLIFEYVAIDFSSGNIEIYDNLGRKITEEMLVNGKNKHSVNTAILENGLYHFVVKSGKVIIYQNQLIIIK